MMRLVLTWMNKPWAFELKPGLNRLGRNPTNDYRIADASVSSFHAEVAVSEDEIKVRDLNSTNGTFINDQQVDEGLLRQDDLLRLGTVELKLEEVMVTAPEETEKPQGAAEIISKPILMCSRHNDREASYKCENCHGVFCEECVTVIGHDRTSTMTLCPSCNGQCDLLHPHSGTKSSSGGLIARLTQTLKFNFVGKVK